MSKDSKCRLVVDRETVIHRKSKAPKPARKAWVWFHLTFLCDRCPESTWRTRDINDEGLCYWKDRWQKGDNTIPLWMGRSEAKRLNELNAERVVDGEEFVHIGSLESVLDEKVVKRVKRLLGRTRR